MLDVSDATAIVVRVLDQSHLSPAGCERSRSNHGPGAVCTRGLGLLNPPSFWGR